MRPWPTQRAISVKKPRPPTQALLEPFVSTPDETIDRAMLLTPPGSAAIAVIRIAGAGVPVFLTAHFSRPIAPGKPTHGELREGEKVIDDPVIVRVDEATADLNLHAGPWVIHSTLDLLARSGFQVIQPAPIPLPEWTIDAIDPIEREVLAVLPLAKTELAVRVLLEQSGAWRGLSRVILVKAASCTPRP